MTNPTQGVHIRRIYYASGTPPVPPVLYDNPYDADPYTDVLDAVLAYNGQLSVQGYSWNGTQQIPDINVAPQLISLEVGTVNGFTVVATFNTDVVASNYATGWTYKVNGVSTTITSAARQGNHAIVRFIVPIPWHGSIDDLTLEYDSNVGDYASESNNIVLASIDVQTITNNITWSALLDLQADTGVTTSVAPFAGTGTAAQAVNTLTGVGTAFLSEVVIGDVITGTGINGTVTAIASDTSLTLSSSATAGAVAFTITPQAASARVTTWADQSGNGHDFTQTGTARPSKQTIGGYSAITHDGVNDWLNGGNFADNLASFTVMTLANDPGNDNGHLITKHSEGTSPNDGWSLDPSDYGFMIEQGAGENSYMVFLTDYSFYFTNFVVVTGEKKSNSELHMWFNQQNTGEDYDIVGTVTSFTNSDPVAIGRSGANGAQFTDISYRSAMIFVPAPPAADRAALETRLGARYGLTVP